jgi:ankyrin repeat protein
MKAIVRGDKTPEGMLQTLVEAEADIEARGDEKITVLNVAAFRGLKGVVDTLISLKADVNSVIPDTDMTPLVAALSKGHTAVAESLVAAGGTATGLEGVHQLNMALCRGNEAAVDILLKAKADVNAKAKTGFTPLKSALNARHLHLVEKLIAAGADTVKDRRGLLGVCRVRDIDPAVIGVLANKGSGMSKADTDRKSSARVAPEDAATA